MRSKLFVPAARPDLFAKALAGEADALSFDLEDAVPSGGKSAARAHLVEWLASDAARGSRKTIIVRVNAPDTPHFTDDITAVARDGVGLINLPKIADAVSLRDAAAAVAEAARGNGAPPPGLLVTIETPGALARAAKIATAHDSVAGLQVGLNDLFAGLGIDRRRREHVHMALWTIRLAAGEAGCFAYDGAWPDITDADGFRAEAALARSLGYVGKSCIHPAQVALANEVFGADAAALERARRIVAGARAAETAGHGAFTLDGEMIDRPAISQAEAMLADERDG